jgi:hypothetical protein
MMQDAQELLKKPSARKRLFAASKTFNLGR